MFGLINIFEGETLLFVFLCYFSKVCVDNINVYFWKCFQLEAEAVPSLPACELMGTRCEETPN